jgi:hypothetical protein
LDPAGRGGAVQLYSTNPAPSPNLHSRMGDSEMLVAAVAADTPERSPAKRIRSRLHRWQRPISTASSVKHWFPLAQQDTQALGELAALALP